MSCRAVLVLPGLLLTSACGGIAPAVSVAPASGTWEGGGVPERAAVLPASDASVPAEAEQSSESGVAQPGSARPETGGRGRPGDVIGVDGFHDGVRVSVRLVALRRNLVSADRIFRPAAGKRWFAVRLAIRNVGTTTLEDVPALGTELVTRRGRTQRGTFLPSSVLRGMLGSISLRPGERATGWVVFAIPRNTAITEVRFRPEHGLSKAAAVWRLES